MSENKAPFTPQDTALVLIDHQPGVLAMIGSLSTDTVRANTGILARLGENTEIPLFVTTTREDVPFLGTSIDEVQHGAPNAYAGRYARGGSLDAFSHQGLVTAVKATGRTNLLLAGVLTDVCLWNSVVSAQRLGFRVRVADASGTTTELADHVTYENLREIGVEVTTTYMTLFEMFNDLSTAEGQKAEAIASGQFVAA